MQITRGEHNVIPYYVLSVCLSIRGIFLSLQQLCSVQNQLGREWHSDPSAFGGTSPTWLRGLLSPFPVVVGGS